MVYKGILYQLLDDNDVVEMKWINGRIKSRSHAIEGANIIHTVLPVEMRNARIVWREENREDPFDRDPGQGNSREESADVGIVRAQKMN